MRVSLALFVAGMFGVSAASAAEIESKIAHGGLLYDNWTAMNKGASPKETHPSYPKDSKKKGTSTWRCKECHGWDYKGKDGHYGAAGHGSFTGIKGIRAMDGADPAKIEAILRDKTHALTNDMLSQAEFEALALFVAKGQTDMDSFINPQTGKALGNAAKGEVYFNTVCAKCHGTDGRKPKEMPESLGNLANRVPWEVAHKIRNADPAPEMPALRAFPLDIQIDILAYTQTLTKER
jgi:thiosulfate dehydrogenase